MNQKNKYVSCERQESISDVAAFKGLHLLIIYCYLKYAVYFYMERYAMHLFVRLKVILSCKIVDRRSNIY